MSPDKYAIRQTDMSTEMPLLLDAYPRETWEAHPGFKENTRHWLGAHQMFRRVAERVRRDAEGALNKDVPIGDYVRRLSHFGGNLVGNLHGHHGWEDHSYLPELSAADPRFDAGLAVLEKDDADLDVVLDDFARRANRVIALSGLDERKAVDEVGVRRGSAQANGAFLKRHLDDEEDRAVPIILHHRSRG